MSPPLITVREVTKIYHLGQHEVHALRGITVEIPRGGCVFVVGPSGSGKSSLLYLMGALDRPTSGSLQIDGKDLTLLDDAALTEYRRRQVGFVFQSFNLISNLTALENVLVPFLPTGVTAARRREAARLLEQVGLGDRLDHRPAQLSGGEQQRVAIARAIFKHPLVVLADEPTGELDTETGREVFRHLRALQAENQATVIVVTHDRRFIKPNDTILEIRDGRLMDGPDGN